MSDLLVVAVVGLGSYAMRVSFIALAGSRPVPAAVTRILDQVQPAVLTALTVTAVVGHGPLHVWHVAGVATAVVVGRRGGNLAVVLVAGMAAATAVRVVT